MDYDLTRLGTREFEHVVQALALKLGAGVRVFGDGPDGGREAAFDGLVSAPSGARGSVPWDGHGVIQAKFRARPTGGAEDAGWFLTQLRDELGKWADPKSRRARMVGRPEFMLVATNVVLSPASDTGGIDKVDKLFAEYAAHHGLKGWAVWHYDHVCRLLDDNADVRASYAALITPGDVLLRLSEVLDGTAAGLGDDLAAHAAKELLSDRWVRLGQAGSLTGEKLALSDIAIDLPAVYTFAHRDGGYSEGASTVAARHVVSRDDPALPVPFIASTRGFVIVGGPGQGKTTIAQLLCQAYRVALLGDGTGLGDEVQSALRTWRERLATLGLEGIANRRWPIRVDLAVYADAIAGGEDVSLLRFIADMVTLRLSGRVTAAGLLDWLKSWPWLLVLDGLDEVAAPSIRETLLRNLLDFYVDVDRVNANVLVVLTTRPQGFVVTELVSRYDFVYLKPLTPDMAIDYGTTLVAVRDADDPAFCDLVIGRLRKAAYEETTARLMRSPLQVTIMALLLERMERAPQSRYALFKAYYDTIYAREVEKGGAVGRLLEQHRSHIDDLHEQVGLRLQAAAETENDAEAQMPVAALRELAAARLTAEEYTPEEVEALTDRIINATTQRLVLLTPKALGHVGYEVRTLQEYMAARALTTGSDSDVIDRLQVLLPSAHWRNTWLFAAGRLFMERELVRADVLGVLAAVDTQTRLNVYTLPGVDIALDLLDDNIAGSSPRYRRQLIERAVRALNTPPLKTVDTVAAVLLDVASNDAIAQSIVMSTAEAAMADPLARVYSSALLDQWRDLGGSLPKRAQKLLEMSGAAHEERHAARIFYGSSPGDSITYAADPSHVTTTLASALSSVDAIPVVRSGDIAYLLGLLVRALGQVEVGLSPDDLNSVTVTVVPPTPTLTLPAAVQEPTVADAFADMIERVANWDWTVTAVLRRYAQHGQARAAVGQRVGIFLGP